jgi:hypothetical protein
MKVFADHFPQPASLNSGRPSQTDRAAPELEKEHPSPRGLILFFFVFLSVRLRERREFDFSSRDCPEWKASERGWKTAKMLE